MAADIAVGASSSHPQAIGALDGDVIALGDGAVGSVLYRIDVYPYDGGDGGDGGSDGAGGDGSTTGTDVPPPVTGTPAPVVAAPLPVPVRPPAAAPARRHGTSLTLKVAAGHHATAPFRYNVTGRLGVPTGTTKAKACQGTVVITARRGTKVVARATAKLAKDCTYAVRVTKSTKKLLAAHGGTLKLTARFSGSAALLPLNSKAATVSYGKR
jgi:hypothetical protein